MNKKVFNSLHLSRQTWLAVLSALVLVMLAATIANKANIINGDRIEAIAQWPQKGVVSLRATEETAAFPPHQEATSVPTSDASIPTMKKICFSRGRDIYLFDVETRGVKRIAKGDEPSISPNGETIAFTVYKDEDEDLRTIKTINVQSKQEIEYPSLPSHSFAPDWSHDGKKLAFSFYLNNAPRRIGILNPTTGLWFDVTESLQPMDMYGVYFDSWLWDDKSILCHDMNSIYEIGLDGKLLQKLPIDRFTNPGEISSSTRFSFSRDRKRLLFDTVNTPEDTYLSLYDFEKGTQLRLTPATAIPLKPEWLPSDKEILFVNYKGDERNGPAFDVCQVSLDGGSVTTLIKDACHASYSIR